MFFFIRKENILYILIIKILGRNEACILIILHREHMNCYEDKIAEYTLALLYLVVNERHEGLGAKV